MKTFPFSPTTMEVTLPSGEIRLELLAGFKWEESGWHEFDYMGWRNDGDTDHPVKISEIKVDTTTRFEAVTPEGVKVLVRAYNPYDPVRAGMSAIPWPKSVAKDAINGDGPMTLNALVDVNGDVATMMLDSPSASYLRYDGQWVLLPDIDAIDDWDIVAVEDTALDIYDPVDQTGKSVKITSMPISPEDEFRAMTRYAGTPEAEASQPLLTTAITSGGAIQIPVIATARDLPTAIDFAIEHPEFQWYVERRAKALREDMSFPWKA